jgi:hypothetical protein
MPYSSYKNPLIDITNSRSIICHQGKEDSENKTILITHQDFPGYPIIRIHRGIMMPRGLAYDVLEFIGFTERQECQPRRGFRGFLILLSVSFSIVQSRSPFPFAIR